MAIFDHSSNSLAKYCLASPIAKMAHGKTKVLKPKIIHNVFNSHSKVIDYYNTYHDLITAMCLNEHMYAVRVNPSNYELRGVAKKQCQFAEFINSNSIKIIVCSKFKDTNTRSHEFVIDETMFDNYLQSKPVRNPNYIPKNDHWIIQIIKGTWDASEPKSELDNNVFETKEAKVINDKLDPIVELSSQLFHNMQPLTINAIKLSKSDNIAFDMQVTQYDDVGNSVYTYIPVPLCSISDEQYTFLDNVRIFKAKHANNVVNVNCNIFELSEYIHTVEVIVDSINNELIHNEVTDTLQDKILIPAIVNDVNNFQINVRNDMITKYFESYQPCVITGLEFSNLTGNLYSIDIVKSATETFTILIPTTNVFDRDKNFFTEFYNKLKKGKFVRIENHKITFADDCNTDFEELISIVEDKLVDTGVSQDDNVWDLCKFMFTTIDDTDDQFDIMLEPLPVPKCEFKEHVRLFFWATFKDAPTNRTLTFAIQNEGRTVVLHYDNIDNPTGKKILYGCMLTEFDVGIQKIIKDCVNNQIQFFNSDKHLVAKSYCKRTKTYITKKFIALT